MVVAVSGNGHSGHIIEKTINTTVVVLNRHMPETYAQNTFRVFASSVRSNKFAEAFNQAVWLLVMSTIKY